MLINNPLIDWAFLLEIFNLPVILVIELLGLGRRLEVEDLL